MTLTVDRVSDTWRAVEAHAKAEIEAARSRLEAPLMSERDADMERGRVDAMRRLLRMATPKEASAMTPPVGSLY